MTKALQLALLRHCGRYVRKRINQMLVSRDARIHALEREVRVLRSAIVQSTDDNDVLRMLASGPGDADD